MSERPSLETRLARRATRDYAAGGTMRRRADRHAGDDRLLSRMEARSDARLARYASYTERSASGSLLISRLAARTGEGRALRSPTAISLGYDDGLVAATPPWLARQAAAEEAIPRIRRRISQPTPAIQNPVIVPVAGSAPLARQARRDRSSGVAPPSMSLASLAAPSIPGPTAAAPLDFGAPSGPSNSFSSAQPLSRTAAAVWSTPSAPPARRRAQRPGTRVLARLEDAQVATAATPRGPLRIAPTLARASAAPTPGRGFSVARKVAASLQRSAVAYPELEHLIAPSLPALEPTVAVDAPSGWARVARSTAPAQSAAPPGPLRRPPGLRPPRPGYRAPRRFERNRRSPGSPRRRTRLYHRRSARPRSLLRGAAGGCCRHSRRPRHPAPYPHARRSPDRLGATRSRQRWPLAGRPDGYCSSDHVFPHLPRCRARPRPPGPRRGSARRRPTHGPSAHRRRGHRGPRPRGPGPRRFRGGTP